ncbi:MAG: Nif11-like leader peptide family RiPP precursor [Bacteroides sp.]|nr:Nif11-like leader peptide family RiPP precursor [Prevotella sp.]MCM1407251.1 Nif11-like leader peptide family RiPP precursor [Treponema brennaborense]MCM1469739.1 Nif11-like leader peptide family RiPP precursor [Bacteroides sp.]
MEKDIEKLAEDQEFLKKISSLTSKEDIKNAFAEKGVNIADNELDIFYKMLTSKELPDEVLENVSGGGIFNFLINIVRKIVF